MTRPRTIDIHTHILTDETIGLLAKEAPRVSRRSSPRSTPISRCWKSPARPTGRSRAAAGSSSAASRTWMRPRSTCMCSRRRRRPISTTRTPPLAVATSALQNDQIAKLVKAHPDRFMGIATLPMQAPERAAEELTPRRAQARHARRHDRLQRRGQEPRRPVVRAGVGDGGGARRLHAHPSEQCRRRRPAALVLSRQPDRQSARHHDRGRVPRVRRRDGAASEAQRAAGARRRLRAVSGRALGARLARAAGAEGQHQAIAGAVDRPVLLRHHPAREAAARIPGRRRSGRRACCSAATIPTTWAPANACGRSRRCGSTTPRRRRSSTAMR